MKAADVQKYLKVPDSVPASRLKAALAVAQDSLIAEGLDKSKDAPALAAARVNQALNLPHSDELLAVVAPDRLAARKATHQRRAKANPKPVKA